MDLWNNQIGRELAEEMSEKYGRDICMNNPVQLKNSNI
jgi:hypothetical protein